MPQTLVLSDNKKNKRGNSWYNPVYDSKLQELTRKVAELEKRAAAPRDLIQPGFDLRAFHTFYDPLRAATKEAHDLYHELLQTVGYGHREN